MTDDKPDIWMPDHYYEMLDGASFVDGVAGPVSGVIQAQELWKRGDEYLIWEYRYGASGRGSGIVDGPFTEETVKEQYPWLFNRATQP